MEQTSKNQTKHLSKLTYYEGVGRRREATAHIRMYPVASKKEVTIGGRNMKKGEIVVNDKAVEQYFPGEIRARVYEAPLKATNTLSSFVVTAVIRGGGPHGQLEAFVHGISRALDEADREKYHTILKKHKFLTRDARVRERRKVGLGGRARARKQSPKR
ncbi:30S ribosomal protein S9 [Candidatus Roizmanbacteria bacterium]|nr:30S ribosomal protein S9 [Candidatus Roizmanbacteria bacterium]